MEDDGVGDASPILIDDAQRARGGTCNDSVIELPDGNRTILSPAASAEPAEGVDPVVNRNNPGLEQVPVSPGSTDFHRSELHTVKVLYLFAGKQRKRDIAYWFHKLKGKYGREARWTRCRLREMLFDPQNSELQ